MLILQKRGRILTVKKKIGNNYKNFVDEEISGELITKLWKVNVKKENNIW